MNSLLTYFIVLLFSVNGQVVEELVHGNNLFAASLFKEISSHETNNFLVSPFSAEIIFALVQLGAKGKTAEELQASLHLPQDHEQTKSAIKTLLPSLLSQGENYSFKIANKIYIKTDYRIKDEFVKTATEDFFAGMESIDFTKGTEAAQVMNKWVEEKTNNKIRDLISPDILDDLTRAVLINALYFQSSWRDSFIEYLTKNKTFYLDSKNDIQVPMMHKQGVYKYYENSELNAIFLEIPFKAPNVSMVFVLPNEKEGLSSLENQIEKVFLPQQFDWETVEVELPKFRIESSFNLKEILMKLGVVEAFGQKADLSGISDEDLYISAAMQKTFISVKEEGVEAAAATYAVASARIGHFVPLASKYFHADHPFIFYIKVNDLIVFTGRIRSPNGGVM